MNTLNRSLLDKLVAFAQADDNVRALILEGSVAVGSQVDVLSDYDVNVYAREHDRYLTDDHWLAQIGDVLLYQREQFTFHDVVIPTRLVLFRDQPRVDFSFWSISLLEAMVCGEKVYESYKNGFQILVDKDGLAQRLPPPDGTGFRVSPPERDVFLKTLYDFWFEAHGMAKYLARRDLWYAKRIEDRYMKDHLFQMALWHHQAGRDWQPDPLLHTGGKRFEAWASPALIAEVTACFSPYEIEATWRSLLAMLDLFDRLARETADQLHVTYPEQTEEDLREDIQKLRDYYAESQEGAR